MSYDANKVIQIAEAEIGYLEKKTNAKLDDKTANAGNKNYTKYARDLDALGFYNGRKNGFAWCDIFVDWCFVRAYGLEAALKLTNQPLGKANCGAGCRYSRNYYKKAKRLFDAPQPGGGAHGTGVSGRRHVRIHDRGQHERRERRGRQRRRRVQKEVSIDIQSHCRIRPSRLGGGSSRRACGGSGCSESQAYSGEGEFREPARGRRREIRK